MLAAENCPECKVPSFITGDHVWLDNGVIAQKSSRKTRPYFLECENMDPLFDGIAQIVGKSIEPIVITTKRRNVKAYIEGALPGKAREMLRERALDWRPINDYLRMTARLNGYGKYEVVEYRCEGDDDDFVTETVSDPLSVPYACGTMAAAFEILFARELGVRYRRISRDLLEMTCFPEAHSEEFKGKLRVQTYEYREGDVDLKRCATCGGPAALSGYRWYPNRGVIKSSVTGKRMAILGSETDAVFGELEREFGEIIPRAVVEAQRRFVRSGFYSIDEVGDQGDIRAQLALRGLGNLREIRMGRRGVHMVMENAGLPLMVIGLAQGLFEMAFGIESNADWELSPDGCLEVEVSPRGVVDTYISMVTR